VPCNEHGRDYGLGRAGGRLHGNAVEAGVRRLVALAKPVLDPGVADFSGGLGQIDDRLECLDLAKEELVLAVRVGPVLEKLARDLRSALVFAFAPVLDLFANPVDLVVWLNPVLGSLSAELELLALLLGWRNRDEVSAGSATKISFVMPSSQNRKCRLGSGKGELRIGFSMTVSRTGSILCCH
jgi:hypothetical protein